MSKNLSSLLSAIEKRDILYGARKVSVKDLTTQAKAFESVEWESDAVDFYIQAGERTELERLQSEFAKNGDVFLFLKVARFLGEEGTFSSQLKTCAEQAESLGKVRYAIKAYEKLEMPEKVKTLQALIANDGDVISQSQQDVFIPLNEEEFLEAEEES